MQKKKKKNKANMLYTAPTNGEYTCDFSFEYPRVQYDPPVSLVRRGAWGCAHTRDFVDCKRSNASLENTVSVPRHNEFEGKIRMFSLYLIKCK